MEEVRRNNIIKIKYDNENSVEGVVIDYISDRIMVMLNHDDIETSKQLKELDKVDVTVHTPLGIKSMQSHIITPTDKKGYIIVENVPSARISQRREFVRIEHSFQFNITTSKDKTVTCECSNISAGGIAFTANKEKLDIDENITIIFPAKLFEKKIVCDSKIIKTGENNSYTAKFNSLNPYDEDKIVKYVFKLMTRIVE